jgi:twinkle protein
VARSSSVEDAEEQGRKVAVPTPHDVSGSAHFWNKADNCITFGAISRITPKQEVHIHVQKVRFKHIGHIGLATLIRPHDWPLSRDPEG